MGVGPDRRAGADARVLQHAVGADSNAVAEFDRAFEDAADVDLDVAAAAQLAALVESLRIGEANAGRHEPRRRSALVVALEIGELRRAVDAEHLGLAARADADDLDALGHRALDDVGEVVLAGGVVVAQRRQPALERARRRHHHAGVDLADLAHVGGRVLVLDDRDDRVGGGLRRRADDAAVAARLGELDGEQGQALRAGGGDQALQGLGLDQRHVAVEDDRRAVVVEEGRCLLQRVAGAELRLLAHEGQARRLHALFDLVGAMTGDDDRAGCPQAGSGAENMLQ